MISQREIRFLSGKKCCLEEIFEIMEKRQKRTAVWERNLKSGKEDNAIGR